MRKLFLLLAILVQVGLANGQEAKYQVSLDLIDVIDDQVKVTIIPPKMEEDVAEYHMAKIVPGTYSISDFGRFVVDFQAFDAEGGALDRPAWRWHGGV